jgi:sugar-specific transcriptional regulator TrmB
VFKSNLLIQRFAKNKFIFAQLRVMINVITMQTDLLNCLMAYGLTLNQAKIYLTMVQTKADTIKKISNHAGLAMEIIYRSMPGLQQMQLVEKELSVPSKFKAISPSEACRLLKAVDKKGRNELYRQTDSFLKKISEKQTNPLQEEIDTTLISGYDAFTRKLGLALQKMNKTFCGITNADNFRIGMLNNGTFYEKCVKKGINCNHIIQLSKQVNSLILGDDHLVKSGLWKRKFMNKNLVEFAILDKKQLFMSLTVPQQGKNHKAIHTTNPCLLLMATNYFDSLWNEAKDSPELLIWS